MNFKSLIIVILALFTLITVTNAQKIQGGAGVVHVTGDPDNIPHLDTVDLVEAHVAYDRDAELLFFYNPNEPIGERWDSISLKTLQTKDTRLNNPRVTNDTLVFDILQTEDNSILGMQKIPILDIAPIQKIIAGTAITVDTKTDSGFVTINVHGYATFEKDAANGTYTYTNTDSVSIVIDTILGKNTIIADTAGHFTSTHIEGALEEIGDSLKALNAISHIPVVTVDGQTIDFTADSTDNQRITAEIKGFNMDSILTSPVIDKDGNLVWAKHVNGITFDSTTNQFEMEISNLPSFNTLDTLDATDEIAISVNGVDQKIEFGELLKQLNIGNPVVDSMSVDTTGQFIVHFSDGSMEMIDLSDIPEVANTTDIETLQTNLGPGKSGLAKAANMNTFGLPARNDWGVLFVVEGK